jgi:predicted Zn-dependent peptidase
MFRKLLSIVTLAAMGLGAQTIDRTKAPQSPPIPGYKLPPVFETKLPNGLSVVVVEDARFPLVTARLIFQAGSKYDPKDIPGLADAVASLLNEGTKTRTSRQISEETDALGGSIGAGAGADTLTASGSALAENLAAMLGLLADITRNATFPANEVKLYQQNRLQELEQQHSQPGFLAEEKISEVVFGSSPYAHIGPTEASIQKLDPATLAKFRDACLAPNNATLVLLGKLPAREALMKTVAQLFGDWKQKAPPAAPKMDLPAARRQIILVDRPGSVQADIHVGRLAPTRLTPDYFPLMVGTNILGGGANSRLFRDVRERDGFAYDAHSSYATNRDAAMFAAVTEVRNEVIEPAMKDVLDELNQMATKPVAAEELTNTKNYLAGLYLLRLETQAGLAAQLANMKALGLPNDYLETYTTRVRSVEPDQILAVARKYMAPDQAAIVVVGDASKIGDALKKFGEVTIAKAN